MFSLQPPRHISTLPNSDRRPQLWMFGAIALRHEHLDWFSKQFIPYIAEHPLSLIEHVKATDMRD